MRFSPAASSEIDTLNLTSQRCIFSARFLGWGGGGILGLPKGGSIQRTHAPRCRIGGHLSGSGDLDSIRRSSPHSTYDAPMRNVGRVSRSAQRSFAHLALVVFVVFVVRWQRGEWVRLETPVMRNPPQYGSPQVHWNLVIPVDVGQERHKRQRRPKEVFECSTGFESGSG